MNDFYANGKEENHIILSLVSHIMVIAILILIFLQFVQLLDICRHLPLILE